MTKNTKKEIKETEATKEVAKTASPETTAKAEKLFDQGMNHHNLKQFEEALNYLKQSLKLLTDEEQIEGDLINKLIANITDCYDMIANNQTENLQYRLDTLKEIQAILPSKNPNTVVQLVRIINNIGKEHLARNDNAAALRCFNNAIISLKLLFPKGDHPYNQPICDNIANACAKLCQNATELLKSQKIAEALDCFNACMISMQNAFPQGHQLLNVSREAVTKILVQFHKAGRELIEKNKHEDALRIFVTISDILLQNTVKPAGELLTQIAQA